MLGKDSPYKGLLAITLIASILTYGGMSIFVVIFTLLPLSRPLFKDLILTGRFSRYRSFWEQGPTQ